MIIKSHTADATVGGQIVDRDFVQRLFEKKFFQGFCQSMFGNV